MPELLQPIVDFVRLAAPKFIALFGIISGIIEFFVRDKEKERVRDFFIRAWLALDRLAKTSLQVLLKTSHGRLALIGLAVVVMTSANVGSLALFEPEDLRDPQLWLVVLVTIGIGALVFFLLRHRIYAFVNDSLNADSALKAVIRLGAIPAIAAVLFWITASIAESSTSSLALIPYAVLLAVFGISVNYLFATWLVYVVLLLVTLLARPLFLMTEWLSLRIAEAQKGPVIAIAVACTALGIALDLLLQHPS
jgi:hypothetical protein